MIITGNKKFGLANALSKIYPYAEYVSRSTGFDLAKKDHQERLAEKVIEHDVFINCSALFKFNQTNLLSIVYSYCQEHKASPFIINIGSTTDRVKKGGSWLYNAEKKALRDYSNSIGITGVWDTGPKVCYISFGTLSNNQEKHPGRQCMDLDKAAEYIQWIVEQPKEICINEISIDPMQNKYWRE